MTEDLMGRGYERIAMCAHPNGFHEHVPMKPEEEAPTTCFAAGCDCEPVVFVRADLHRGVEGDATNLAVAAKSALKILAHYPPNVDAAMAMLRGAVRAHDRDFGKR